MPPYYSYRELSEAEKIGTNCLTANPALRKCRSAKGGVLTCMRGLPVKDVLTCQATLLEPEAADGLFKDFTYPCIDGHAIKCPILEVSLLQTPSLTLTLLNPESDNESDPEPDPNNTLSWRRCRRRTGTAGIFRTRRSCLIVIPTLTLMLILNPDTNVH